MIRYNDKIYIGVQTTEAITKETKLLYPKHGRPECHHCDLIKGTICNDWDVADQILLQYKGCNGFDDKQLIIFKEVKNDI